MTSAAWLPVALIGGALWLILRGRTASAAGTGTGTFNVNSVGPTFNSELEVGRLVDALTDSAGNPFAISVKSPDYILEYQQQPGRPVLTQFVKQNNTFRGMGVWQNSQLPSDWVTAQQMQDGTTYKEIGRGVLADGSWLPIFQPVGSKAPWDWM